MRISDWSSDVCSSDLVVTNIDKTVNGILEASQVAGDKANVDIRVVSVGIAGQHIRSLQHRGILTRNNTNTEISKEDIERLIQDMQRLMMPPGDRKSTRLNSSH